MSKFIRIFIVLIVLGGSVSSAQARVSHPRRAPVAKIAGVSAPAALLWNVTQDKVLFAKNATRKVYAASTTKVMTVLLALEKLSLDQYVTVSARATQVPPTKLDFQPGEQYLVRDLILACLLKSANDAAIVLAEAVAGSQEKFVEMMNQKAQDLGAKDTLFANPNGLPIPTKQFTTARDMAIIFKEALKNDFFQKAITFRYGTISSKGGGRRHFLRSHNKALFLHWKQDVDGKTGFTLKAKSCFVGYIKKGNDLLIVDVFGCKTNRRWDDIKWMLEHYAGVNL
ncbi:MAG: D-alanyl-D-alanine carboxypeptidase [Candidatus Omnitrophica bacterium]|nr:D-alanyl-D-alanine carboxypeptidase [Candidatus Omnitrophota bacterium]